MNCAERVAGHVDGEMVVAAGLFQLLGTAAGIDDEDFLEWQRGWLADNSGRSRSVVRHHAC